MFVGVAVPAQVGKGVWPLQAFRGRGTGYTLLHGTVPAAVLLQEMILTSWNDPPLPRLLNGVLLL